MVTPLKNDPTELNRLLGEGKSTKDIAAHFGCTPGAVSQAKRRIGVALAKASAERNQNPDQVVVAKKGPKSNLGRLDSANKIAPIISIVKLSGCGRLL